MKYIFLFDLARVLVFPKSQVYKKDLNPLYAKEARKKQFKFKEFFIFNDELLNYLEKLANSYEIYMYTSGTMQKDHKIQEKIGGIFSNIFSASQMSLPKTEVKSYLEISVLLNKNPNEIVFVDDNQDNIAAAKRANLTAILYRNNVDLFNQIDKLIK